MSGLDLSVGDAGGGGRPHGHAPVAIIGMSCLFPGAPDLGTYWRNILNKVDAVTDPPPGSGHDDRSFDPESSESDRVYCKRGGYLGALAAFDPLAHGIPPVAVGGEPDQWLALQLAVDAMSDAGYSQLAEGVRQRTAVILGKGTYLNGGNAMAVQHGLILGQTLALLKSLHPEHTDEELEALRQELKKSLPPLGPETVPGLIPNIIVGRIANRLGLMGPAYTVDAACASSLVAIQMALRDLADGACDLALVGGSQVWIPLPVTSIFCQLGALSRRQEIRPFDEQADGTLLGEGIGMVVLKRLAEAERDGDRIYAVIRSVGVSSDGRGTTVMAPRPEGEALALRRAYEGAGVSPRTVGLIEAHGTGTPVGDRIEVQALTSVFGPRGQSPPRCALGSVKSMISHTIPASGVAGLIKAALALYYKVLPPMLNCTAPNPKLELEKTPFYLNTETRPWIHGGEEPRRAGINSFGFGGINAHAVVEEFIPASPAGRPRPDEGSDPPSRRSDHQPAWETEVCILGADSPAGLRDEVRRLARILDGASSVGPSSIRLQDLAYTLNRDVMCSGSETGCRLAVVAGSLPDLREKLARAASRLDVTNCRKIRDVSGIYHESEPLGRQGKLAYLFPGEGAQYPNMLADLCLHLPEVRECFDRADRAYAGHPRGYVLSDLVFPPPRLAGEVEDGSEGRLWQMDGAIEAVLTADLALLAVLDGLGLRPDMIVGHSSGEYAALRTAGLLDLRTDEQWAWFAQELNRDYERAASCEGVPRAVLLAVGAGRERVEAIARAVGDTVHVAMDNCPHQVVLAGEAGAMERAMEMFRAEGLIAETLAFDRPYHSPLFAPYTEHLRDVIDRLPIGTARVPLYSCTSVAPFPDGPDRVRSLMLEHWLRPVEFRRTVDALYDDGARIFVEVGPRGNLTAFVEDILRGRPSCAIPADTPRRQGIAQLNHLVGLLAVQGIDMDLEYLHRRRDSCALDLEEIARAPAPARLGHRMPLQTGFPEMRASEELIQRFHEAALTRNIKATDPREAAAPCGPEAPILAPVVPELDGMAEAIGFPGAIESYFQTMEQFLGLQQRMMRRCVVPGQQLPGGEPGPDEVVVPVSRSRPDPQFPLLGEVITWVPGGELVARRTFDPAEDLYLRDHTLGRHASALDPGLHALAVMPLAMSLEILAEAAAALRPGKVLTGLRNVRAARWVAFEDGSPQRLEVRARAQSEDGAEVVVRLRNLTEDEKGDVDPEVPVIEATVIFADSHPRAEGSGLGPPADRRPSRLEAESLYHEHMFHGPLWQGVAAVQSTGVAGTRALVRVLPTRGYLRSDPDPRFVLDPAVLDAAGQVIGFWTIEHLDRGKVIFPFRLDSLEIFGTRPPAGEVLSCSASIELIGEHRVRSDLDIVDRDGRAWMRLVGWEDRRFDLPDALTPLILPSGAGGVSRPWGGPIADLSPPGVFECRWMRSEVTSDVTFWRRVWAQRILGRAERAHFARLTVPPDRQFDWLAGRVAAKEAVRHLLEVHRGLRLGLADIEILPDPKGCLRVGGAWLGLTDVRPVVSIAHADELALAVAGLSVAGADLHLGVDVEILRGRSEGFSGAAFSDEETAILATLPPDLHEEWMLRAWCAKRSVSRALGLKLVEGPLSALIAAIDIETETIVVRLDDRLSDADPGFSLSPGLVVTTVRHDDLIVSITLCQPAGAEPVGHAARIVA